MFRTARYSTGWLIMYGSLNPVINRIIARRTPIRPGLRTSFLNESCFCHRSLKQVRASIQNVEYGNENWAVKPTVITENCLLEGQRHKCTVWIDCCKADNSLTAFIFIMKIRLQISIDTAKISAEQVTQIISPLKSSNENSRWKAEIITQGVTTYNTISVMWRAENRW